MPDGSDDTLLEQNAMDLEDMAYSPVIPNVSLYLDIKVDLKHIL